MAKKGSFLGKLFGVAAVAGAAQAISQLEKEAKEQGKDILDVAKDKLGNVVENVKSGEALEKVTDFAEKTVENVKSGEFVDTVKDKLDDVMESVKSGEFAEKAKETAANLKDGVVDIFDGKEENIVEEVIEAVEDEVDQA